MGDCTRCDYWRGRMNPKTGTLIPKPDKFGWASGKCTRPGGHCSPYKVK